MTIELLENNLVLVITTESDYNNASNLASFILEMRLAKCISLTQIDSMYWWDGELQDSKEVQLTIKTKLEFMDQLLVVLKKKHTYQLPEVICISASSSKKYNEWLFKSP